MISFCFVKLFFFGGGGGGGGVRKNVTQIFETINF